MFDREKLSRLAQKRARWDEEACSERAASFVTTSGSPIRRLYDPTDIEELDYERDLGLPGMYP